MTVNPITRLRQCPNEKRYPIRCPYADGSKTSQCEKCFIVTNPDDETDLNIIEDYMKSVEHLPESSKETIKFYWRDIER